MKKPLSLLAIGALTTSLVFGSPSNTEAASWYSKSRQFQNNLHCQIKTFHYTFTGGISISTVRSTCRSADSGIRIWSENFMKSKFW